MSGILKPYSFGLNRAAELAAKRAAKKEASKVQPLDPLFPYRAVPLDVEFFGLGRNVLKK